MDRVLLMHEALARVENGVRWLDQYWGSPAWVEMIDLNFLQMKEPHLSPLGLLSSAQKGDFAWALERFGLTEEQAELLGFCPGADEHGDDTYLFLNAAWFDALREYRRRLGDPTPHYKWGKPKGRQTCEPGGSSGWGTHR